MAGRKIKRDYPRTETIKIRISRPHLKLLKRMQEQYQSDIVSQADVIEWALEKLGGQVHLMWPDPEDV